MTESRFTLPYPPSVNQLFAGKSQRHKSPEYKEWIKEAALHLKSQKDLFHSHIGEVSLYFAFSPPDNRERDLDNLLKATIDFLVENKIIEGDSQRYVRQIRADWIDKNKKATCFVCIRDLEQAA